MIALAAALALVPAVHAAPVAATFESTLAQIRRDALAAAAQLITQEQLQKVDKNIALTDNQAYQSRSRLAGLLAQARTQPSDPGLRGQLSILVQDLDVYESNCEVVRQQVMDLAKTAVKDPTLAALAKKLYGHAQYLDSDAGYLAIDARNANVQLSVAGYGGEAYQIQRLALAAADLTPDVRTSAKSVLDKVQ